MSKVSTKSEPSGPVRQHHSLATGQGLTPAPSKEKLVNTSRAKTAGKKSRG